MRFLFRPPAAEATGLLSLPWGQPLAEWDPELLLEVPQRGISRHVVRFVATGGQVFALKEINERLARHEYALLAEFEEEGLPTVSVLGICVDRPGDQEAILVTRYLEYSMSYRWLFSRPRGAHSADQLLDTMVELLVRLHLAGVFWGDCSLSNTLFRLDAGRADRLPGGRRDRGPPPDALAGAAGLRRRPRPGARGCRAAGPAVRRAPARRHRPDRGRRQPAAAVRGAVERGDPRGGLQQRRAALAGRPSGSSGSTTSGSTSARWSWSLDGDGVKLRVETRVSEPGQHRRELFRLTGLEVQERQARRLLNDIRAFRAHLEQKSGRAGPGVVRGAPLAGGGLPAGRGRDPAGPRRPAGARPRSSTRCSSTAGSSPSRPSATSGPPRRRSPTSGTCCPRRPRRSPRRRSSRVSAGTS